jgi:hypothetical protein
MKVRRKRIAIAGAAVLAAALVAALLIYRASEPVVVTDISGAVLREDVDPHKQRPIENAAITAVTALTTASAVSDHSGFFRLRLRPPVLLGQQIRLTVRHADFLAAALVQPAGDEIQVIRLAPTSREVVVPAPPSGPPLSISNVRVRYAVTSTTTEDVGSAVRTFDVENTGNVPCRDRRPCSPDGRWKATVKSLPLDAGADKQFRNVRVSCISGPCPFTRLESDNFSRGGRLIEISVRNWSDPVTYLVEAEVVQAMGAELVRRSYPAIFGRSMNFTLPAAAQGPSIEAEVGGSQIVFPLGPRLILSWADCRLEIGADRTKLYRCDLKPQYIFR